MANVSVWISGDDNQSAFTIVCLRFVLDCYGSLSHILTVTVSPWL